MWRTQPRRRLANRALRIALVALYLGGWGLVGLLNVGPTDLDAFFWPAARIALAGDPWGVYRVRFGLLGPLGLPRFPAPGLPMPGYPDANGPLSLAPLTAVAWLAARLGWLDDLALRRGLALAVFAIFALLMGHTALRLVEDALGRRLRGGWRLAAYALFALSPELLRSMLLYGHIEQPLMLWLILAATRILRQSHGKGRGGGVSLGAAWQAGALLGLALLTRSTALLAIIPLALVLLRQRQWRATATLLATAGGVAALGLAPFWLADRRDLTYSLVAAHALIPIGGGTFWGLWVLATRQPLGLAIVALGMRADTLVVVGMATLITVVALLARRDLIIASREVYALLALCSLCFLLFDKTLWPYYYLEPYTFAAVWWLLGLAQIANRAQPAAAVQAVAQSGASAATPADPPTEAYAEAHTEALAGWRLGVALPTLAVVAASLDEYLLSQQSAGAWPLLWGALAFAATLTLGVALLVALRPRSSPPLPIGDKSGPAVKSALPFPRLWEGAGG